MAITETQDENAADKAEARGGSPEIPVVRIRPPTGWGYPDLGELWAYRELGYFLVWRDVKVRYKQTVLGVAWAILEPFVTMVVFSIFFGGLAGIPSDGVPYPVWSFAALVPWAFFANGVTKSANSLVGSANMLKKVYFPRLIMPGAAVLAGLVDFAFAFVVLLGMMLFFRIVPTRNVVWLPALLLLAFITSLGTGLWFSALNVRYRDVRFVVPLLLRVWLFITPVVYPSSLLEEPWRTLYGLNPMAGVVEGFRWALLDTNPPNSMILLSALVAIAVFVTGTIYFRRMEDTFADVV
jgi:lipopolysaccharide transport system permease protein